MADFVAKLGSTARSLFVTLTSTNAGDDLSGAGSLNNAKLYMRPHNGATNKINGVAATIVSATATAINVRYGWVGTDVDTLGDYDAYLLVEVTAGKFDRFPADGFITIKITRNFE